MIISFLNQKGGCGKTTLALNFATYVANNLDDLPFDEVVLIDTDRQESLTDWHAARLAIEKPTLQLLALQRENTLRSFKASSNKLYVLDGGGKADDLCIASIKLSDLIVVPIKASPMDIWSMAPIFSWIKERQKITDGQPLACYALTMCHMASKITKDAIESFGSTDLDLLPGSIKDRVIYKNSAMRGLSIYDTNCKYSSNEAIARINAQEELDNLSGNILAKVGIVTNDIAIGGTDNE